MIKTKQVHAGREGLEGMLDVPRRQSGLVIFAHGTGSGRLSPRNTRVAAGLREAGLTTLLVDLHKPEEERDRADVFDVELASARLQSVAAWARSAPQVAGLPIGFFGASTGAAAAMVAATRDGNIAAIVSRGGPLELAGEAVSAVRTPTLLIVGAADEAVLAANRAAFDLLQCEKELVIVPEAGHLFEEPGALEQVVDHARRWFLRHLRPNVPLTIEEDVVFSDRREAGRQLASVLTPFKDEQPVVLALPRGGVPVAFEVAKALNAPLDVVLVRKIGAPDYPELGLGAVMDGRGPQLVLNDDVLQMTGVSLEYIRAAAARELQVIERRRQLYADGKPMIDLTGRTLIIVDDGMATGGTAKTVLRGLARYNPRRRVLAIPVAPRRTIEEVSREASEVVCLSRPSPFLSVGSHYRDFHEVLDAEVIELLRLARSSGSS